MSCVPWPDELLSIDIGSFQGDFAKAKRVLGWSPGHLLRRRHRGHHPPLRRSIVVPVVDLRRRHRRFRDGVRSPPPTASSSPAPSCSDPSWTALERELAPALHGTAPTGDHVVGVANGAAALQLVMAALGIGPGDEVVVPAFTAVPTASAVCATGATPVFADVDPATAALDPDAVAAAVTDTDEGHRRRPPVRPTGAGRTAARPRRAGHRGRRPGPRRAVRRDRRGGDLLLLPDEERRRHRRRRRRRDAATRSWRRPSAACGSTA